MPATSSRPIVNTYRLQLHDGFTFSDAAAVVPYLADLGVTHVYCSPWLQSAPGSNHGYDVIDHLAVDRARGGAEGLAVLRAACEQAGLGIVLDIVPNHAAVSEPQSQNAAWWAFLRDGQDAHYADWFDVDWTTGKILVPILGAPLAEVVGDLVLEQDRIRYYDHEVPICPGTLVEGDVLATLAKQHYRLAHWRVATEELNVRRFFDVTTLAGVRVEDESVYEATHRLILEQVRDGTVDGLRIDHPDGLADPGGYLERLAEDTGDAWVVVEKILEPGEDLPDWRTAGTTGYDVLNSVLGLFVDPAGEAPLTELWEQRTGSTDTFADVVETCKHQVLRDVLPAEVNRLVEVGLRVTAALHLDVTRRGLREALVEVLAGFEVYRAYLSPEGPADATARGHVEHALAYALERVPARAYEVEIVGKLALAQLDGSEEFVTRFQQTCGPVMAKGVEDTAFYRYLRLAALNEVGGNPARFGVPVYDFHLAATRAQRDWPLSMTGLSTHDTKRSEDVRARLVLLSQDPAGWAAFLSGVPHLEDGATDLLVWQSLVGAWPITADRACAYVEKATREAKALTSWTDPDPVFDAELEAFVRRVLADADVLSAVDDYVEGLRPAFETTLLAQKLVQLMSPGVADCYQGTELVELSLVDPDNRRPVDYDLRRSLLADLTQAPPKLRLTTAALRLRRDRPDWFLVGSSYDPLEVGEGAIGFVRSDRVAVIAPTRTLAGAPTGSATLPDGIWVDAITGARRAGTVALVDLLDEFAVALLVRD